MIITHGEPIRLVNGTKDMIGDKYEVIKDIPYRDTRKGDILTCDTKGGIGLDLYNEAGEIVCQLTSEIARTHCKKL